MPMGSEVRMMKVMGMMTLTMRSVMRMINDSGDSDEDDDWIVEDFRDFGDIIL